MEDDDDETTASISKTSSTATLTQQNISSSTPAEEPKPDSIPQFQLTHPANGDSQESEESSSARVSPHYSVLSKSPHSSSSQEDYEPDAKTHKGKFLSAGIRTETARSMESLRTMSRTFLSTSERDMRRIVSESVETKSLESLEREMRLKRHAVSGDGSMLSSQGSLMSDEAINSAERRRGLWSGRVRVPQHLSLPPPAGYLSLSPGDRKLTILSPHSPHRMPDLLHLAQTTLKTRRKKAMVLPRLVLPRSDSDISEVFSEHGLE